MTHVDIFIRREGDLDPTHHQVRNGITVTELHIDLHGGDAVGLFLFEEDADEPLDPHHVIEHHGHGPRFLHHSKCRHVHVEVRYAGRPVERSFGPGSTLTRVKDWAEQAFELDACDAAELSLQIAGTVERPDGSTHVGSLATCPDCRVVFDLLPTTRVNG
jgi:hypothetical protein